MKKEKEHRDIKIPQSEFRNPNSFQLAIVGASVRSAADSALRAGLRPLAADLFADSDLQQVCSATRIAQYPHDFLDWLEQTECDGWLYTGALENYPELVDTMAARRPLLGNGGTVLREVRSPLRLAEVLREAGLPFPDTHAFSQINDFPQRPGVATPGRFTGKYESGQFLWKTGRGSSGAGVWHLEDAKPASGDSLFLQRRIDGISYSALFVGNGNESILLGVTRQLVGERWTRAAPMQYCGSIMPHPLPSANLQQQIAKIGNVLSATFGLLGLFGVDMILDGSKAWTIEVNPRYTASVELIERATGVQAIAWHIAACRDGKLPSEIHGQKNSTAIYGKVILFAKQTTTITEGFTHWAFELAHHAAWPDAADIPAPDRVIAARQPIVTLFATGNSAADVEARLHHRVTEAEAMLYGGREKGK